MPDRTYSIKYDASSAAKAATDIDKLTASLTKLDALVDKVKPKLRSIARGMDKSVASGATAVNKLTVACANLSPVASTTATEVKGMTNAVKTGNKHLDTATTSANATTTSFLGISAAAVGMRVAREVIHALSEAFEDAKKFAAETAENTIALKDAVRELKAVSGDKANLDQVTEDVKKLMLATGMKQKEAIDYSVMAGSALSVAKKGGGWQLSDADTEAVKIEAARFAVANDIAPETMGRLLGQVGVAQPVKTQDDVLSQISFAHNMGVDSLAKLTPFMKANQALIGEMVKPEGGGAFKNFAEMTGAVSGLTSVVQVGRIPQVMRQAQAEYATPANDTVAKNFKKYGIEPGKDDFASTTVKLGKYLKDAKARGVANDETALVEFGFPRVGGRRAIANAIHAQQAITEGVDAAKNADPARIRAINDQFDIDQPNRKAEAALEVAKLNRGKEAEDLTVLQKLSEAGHVVHKSIDTAGSNMADAWTDFTSLNGTIAESGRENRINAPIRQAMRETLGEVEYNRRFGSMFAGEQGSGTLAKNLNQLAPAERSAVFDKVREFAAGGREPGDKSDGRLLDVNQRQLEALQNINAKLGNGNGGNGAAMQGPPLAAPVKAPAGPKVGGDFVPQRN